MVEVAEAFERRQHASPSQQSQTKAAQTQTLIVSTPPPALHSKRRKWKWFFSGLAVRLSGLLLIWIGDGSESLFRKALVILGVILSIGGIAVLRYLLITGLRTNKK